MKLRSRGQGRKPQRRFQSPRAFAEEVRGVVRLTIRGYDHAVSEWLAIGRVGPRPVR